MTVSRGKSPVIPGSDDLLARFSAVPYTGAITDVLDDFGHRSQTLPREIRPLDAAQPVVGRAMTVTGAPTESTDPDVIFIPYLRMLGDLQPGHVIVTQPNDTRCAHFGELSCETARARGAVGAVIDGGVRDTGFIIRQGFPVFARYATPEDLVGRWRLTGYGEPIEVGGVLVRPDDVVVGDRDGIVVVPADIAPSVIVAVEAVVATEDLVRRDILAGTHPVEAFNRHGRF